MSGRLIEGTQYVANIEVSMVGESIKERLDAYRRQKRREEMTETIKNAMQTVLPWTGNKSAEDSSVVSQLIEKSEDIQDKESSCSDESVDRTQCCTLLKVVTYLLYFLLWAILYTIAIEYEFGAVYFIVSALIFLWLNTRTRPKKSGEVSAYSVFNPDCKAIEGTLDASQFEREIRYGIGSVAH